MLPFFVPAAAATAAAGLWPWQRPWLQRLADLWWLAHKEQQDGSYHGDA